MPEIEAEADTNAAGLEEPARSEELDPAATVAAAADPAAAPPPPPEEREAEGRAALGPAVNDPGMVTVSGEDDSLVGSAGDEAPPSTEPPLLEAPEPRSVSDVAAAREKVASRAAATNDADPPTVSKLSPLPLPFQGR